MGGSQAVYHMRYSASVPKHSDETPGAAKSARKRETRHRNGTTIAKQARRQQATGAAKRSYSVKGSAAFRRGEVLDLEQIAVAWQCPANVVVYIIVADFLAKARGRKLEDTPMNHATMRTLERAGYYDGWPGGLGDVEKDMSRASAMERLLVACRGLDEAYRKGGDDRYPFILEVRNAIREFDETRILEDPTGCL